MATQPFLDAWLAAGSRPLVVLAQITLSRADGSQTDTLRVGTVECGTTGGPAFLSGIKDAAPVHHPGDFCSTDIPLCSCGLSLEADLTATFPAGAGAKIVTTLRQSLSTHRWIGARVVVWRHFSDMSFADAQQVFDGLVADMTLAESLELTLRQSSGWNRPLGDRGITLQQFPRADQQVVGLPIPILYGRLQQRQMRRPWTGGYTQSDLGMFLPDRRVYPSVLVDKGRGGQATQNQKARVAAASHLVTVSESDQLGFIQQNDVICKMTPYDAVAVEGARSFQGAGLSGWELPETKTWASWVQFPSDKSDQGNEAENYRALFRPTDTQFARFNYAALRRQLWLRFQPIPNVGDWNNKVYWRIGYRAATGLSGFQLLLAVDGGGPDTQFASLAASVNPIVHPTTEAAAELITISGGLPAPLHTWTIKIGFFGAGPAGVLDLFFFALYARFRPKDEILQSGRVVQSGRGPLPEAQRRSDRRQVTTTIQTTPPQIEASGKFFHTLNGLLDDGSGTYTGSAGALIEKMPDILRHVMVAYGAAAIADIDATSFNAARSILVDQLGQPVGYGICVLEQTDVSEVLLRLAADSMSQVFLSPYDSKFRMHVWRTGPSITYTRKISRFDVAEPQGPVIEQLDLGSMVSGVRVAYDYDHHSKTFRSESTLAYNKSVGGFEHRNLRDEYLTVVAGVNDRLNWTRGGSAKVCTLAGAAAPGMSYDPGPLATEVQNKMRAADTATNYWCAHGGTVTDECCVIAFSILAVGYVVSIATGTWTMEQLASLAGQAMNGVGPGGFSVTYSRTTRKFTIANGVSFSLRWCAGLTVDVPNRALALMGYCTDATGTVLTSQFEVEEGRFGVVCGASGAAVNTPIDLNFQSGPDGADSAVSVRYCADVLGYDPGEDKLAIFNALGAWTGDCPKGNRETALRAIANLYGPRREMVIEARTITSTGAARSLRNRVVDLLSSPRVMVRFSTMKMPDLERGDVFQFADDVDELLPYPGLGSDGSWIGKRFVVVELSHNMGPLRYDTVVRAVQV